MGEQRRAVVTGIGAVTPLGNDAAQTWEGLKSGRSGIGPITLFDTENFKAKLAAEVHGFDPKEYMEVNEALRTDRYAQFAVAAAQQAAEESRIEGAVEAERFAVLFGTGIGGITTFEKEHTKLLEKGARRVSPLFVPMMIGNMAAGLIAIRLQRHRGGAQADPARLCGRGHYRRGGGGDLSLCGGRLCQYAGAVLRRRPGGSVPAL